MFLVKWNRNEIIRSGRKNNDGTKENEPTKSYYEKLQTRLSQYGMLQNRKRGHHLEYTSEAQTVNDPAPFPRFGPSTHSAANIGCQSGTAGIPEPTILAACSTWTRPRVHVHGSAPPVGIFVLNMPLVVFPKHVLCRPRTSFIAVQPIPLTISAPPIFATIWVSATDQNLRFLYDPSRLH